MERREYEDVFIPAFFRATKKPFGIIPTKRTNNNVVFIVEGNAAEIDDAVSELFQNVLVPALDLIREIKTLRSSIFALRGGVRL